MGWPSPHTQNPLLFGVFYSCFWVVLTPRNLHLAALHQKKIFSVICTKVGNKPEFNWSISCSENQLPQDCSYLNEE